MTGWRIGFVCGNKDVISGLAQVKSNIDSGVFTAIQIAGIAALKSGIKNAIQFGSMYQERRDTVINGLARLGWKIQKPKATFYVWAHTLKGYDSTSLAKHILEKADVVITPGVGFGTYGEGYIRIALTVGKDRLAEAIERIKKVI